MNIYRIYQDTTSAPNPAMRKIDRKAAPVTCTADRLDSRTAVDLIDRRAPWRRQRHSGEMHPFRKKQIRSSKFLEQRNLKVTPKDSA